MGTLMRAIIVILTSVAPALAASGNELSGNSFPSLLIILFIGFNALFILPSFIAGVVVVVQKLLEFKISHRHNLEG